MRQAASRERLAACRMQQRAESVFTKIGMQSARLLEAEELDDGQRDGGVEAQAALVRAQRAVKLHPIPAVHLRITI